MTALHLHRRGTAGGASLLAIHGITGHGARFDDLCSGFLNRFDVAAPDLRGHGRSTHDAPWNLDTHVDDLVAEMDALGWADADVVGHSLGGNLALRLLAAHPQRVRRVVLLDPAFALPTSFTTALAVATLEDRSFASLDEMVEADRLVRPAAAAAGAERDLRSVAVQGEDGRWRMPHSRAAVVAMWGELSRELPAITTPRPVLLVNAVQAGLVLDAQIATLERALGPMLEHRRVDLGHMVYWEDLDATGRLVAEFLAA